MKNNKGFTLVELLITIAIVGIFGVTVVFSVVGVLRKTYINTYIGQMRDLFNSASTYSNLSSESGGPSCNSGCTITMQQLIEKGLVDKKILNTPNPVYKNKVNFKASDSFVVTKTSGVKEIQFVSGSCTRVKMSTVDSYNWEQC